MGSNSGVSGQIPTEFMHAQPHNEDIKLYKLLHLVLRIDSRLTNVWIFN